MGISIGVALVLLLFIMSSTCLTSHDLPAQQIMKDLEIHSMDLPLYVERLGEVCSKTYGVQGVSRDNTSAGGVDTLDLLHALLDSGTRSHVLLNLGRQVARCCTKEEHVHLVRDIRHSIVRVC